jgi:AhpD family alkylhydroperoxidase
MQARMNNPAMVLPEAMQALLALHKAVSKAGVPAVTLELINLRASQINGCSVCLEMHSDSLRKQGESDQRLSTVSGWRDAPYFTDAERAALALTEAATRLSDRGDAVPDAVWDEAAKHYDEQGLAAIALGIAGINVWNRLNVTTRQVAGAWKP